MAANFKVVCRFFTTTSRLLKKPHIQKPRVPWTERRILNAVSAPIFPPDERPPTMKCWDDMNAKLATKNTELMQAYQAFKRKQITALLNENAMVAICHIIPLNSRDAFAVRAKIMAGKMKLVFINNKFIKDYIQGTRFINLEPFCTSNTVYVASPDNRVADLVAILRKTPELQLLGGLVENTIMSRDMMMNYAKLPPIEVLQGELLTILTSSIATTSHLLSTQQEQLSYNLSQLTQQGDSVSPEAETQGDTHTEGKES